MDAVNPVPEADQVERFEQLARKALAAYGLEDAELRFLGQSANVVFRVQTEEGRWALRICNPDRDRRDLMRELLWLVALSRDTRLGVPEPVIARSGELVRGVSIRGLSGFRPCMLFRWVKGQFADELTAEHLRAVGKLTAGLHTHAETFRWPEELAPPAARADNVESIVPRAVLRTHYAPVDTELLAATVPVIHRILRSLGSGHGAIGAIHGDLHQGNYLFHEGEARAIDFECTGWNYYAYDVATTFSYVSGRPDLDALKRAYVEGYSAVRTLPCDLDAHLPALDMLRALDMVGWVLGRPHVRAPDWSAGVLASAVRKAKRLLGRE